MNRYAFYVSVIVLSVLIYSPAVYALTVDFHGDGTRLLASRETIQVTQVPDEEQPADENESDRETTQPKNDKSSFQGPEQFIADALGFDEFDMQMSGYAEQVDVNGAESRSFKTQGSNAKVDLSLDGTSSYRDGDGSFTFHADIRGSDDPQVVGSKRFQLRGIYSEFKVPNEYKLRLGNVSASFSKYSLSSSADIGADLDYHLSDNQLLKFYVGRPRRETTSSYRRFNSGLRYEGKFEQGILDQYGLSVVQTWDDDSSGEGSVTGPAIENRVVSSDFKMSLSDVWSFSSEAAYSWHDTDTLNPSDDYRNDFALTAESEYNAGQLGVFKQVNFSGFYEEIQPDYRSSSGGGSPDQRTFHFGTNGRYDWKNGILPPLDINYSFRRNYDNLDDDSGVSRVETVNHDFGVQFEPFARQKLSGEDWSVLLRKNMRADFGLRVHDVENDALTTDRQTVEQDYNLSSRVGAQSGKIYYRFQINNGLTPASTRRRRSYGGNYSYRGFSLYSLFGRDIPMDFTTSFSRVEDWTKSDLQTSNHRWRFNLIQHLTKQYRLTSNWSQLDQNNPGPMDDNRRTSWEVGLSGHRFYGDRGQASLRYKVTDVDEQVNSREYQEEEVRVNVEFEF